MIPRRIASASHRFKAPDNWNEERDGPCVELWVRVTSDGNCESAWEPTPEELAILNKGGSVVLRIVGQQPPVWLYAEEQR